MWRLPPVSAVVCWWEGSSSSLDSHVADRCVTLQPCSYSLDRTLCNFAMASLWHNVLLAICTSVMASDECEVSFVQTQTRLRRSRPWDDHVYWAGVHHKAGSHLLRNIMRHAFDGLGASYSCYTNGSITESVTSAGFRHYCPEVPDCHIMWEIAASEASFELARARGNARGAHVVRNPKHMLASAYCYHHRGQEPQRAWSHFPEILFMGPREGMMTLWPEMYPFMYDMAILFEDKDGLYHVRYELLTESSASFDQQVTGLYDFLFGGLVSRSEMQMIAEAAKAEDLNREKSVTKRAEKHTNSDECMGAALQALPSLDQSVLTELEELTVRLGY